MKAPRRGMWAGIGLVLGAGIGVAWQNIAAGASIGLLIGLIIETLNLYNKRNGR